MSRALLFLQSIVFLAVYAHIVHSLEQSDFYDIDRTVRLENGLEKSEFIKLNKSINFFSDIYDHIYVSGLRSHVVLDSDFHWHIISINRNYDKRSPQPTFWMCVKFIEHRKLLRGNKVVKYGPS